MTLMDPLQKNMRFSESEESEEDRGSAALCPTIEDVRDEMDIARFYRSLCSNSMFGHRLQSKSVQTEHDLSGLPQSWVITGQSLVDELYTGLGNTINNLHQPSKYSQNFDKFPRLIHAPNLEYFKYENGKWRFILDPKVNIPADSEAYHQIQIINTENLKNDLGRLMRVATQLRNLVSYLDEINSQPIENTANGDQTILKEDKCQQTEFLNYACQCHNNQNGIQDSEENISFSDISNGSSKADFVSSSREKSSKFAENPENTDIHRRNIDNQDVNEGGKVWKTVPNVKSSQILPGIKVMRYKPHRKIQKCVSEDVERLNPVNHESVANTRNANFDHTELVSRVPSEERKMFPLPKVKDSKNCSKLVNQASQPSTSKSLVQSAENTANKSERNDRKFVKPLGDHNIPVIERARSLYMKSDFPCKRAKTATAGNACKNFIRQNILASRHPTHAGSSRIKCEVQNSTAQDILPFTHSVAGSSSSQTKHTSAPCRQFSSKNRNPSLKYCSNVHKGS